MGKTRRQGGFTLIEAIMVMVITGILAGMVAVFIAKPVEGYVDAVRRAELTDAANASLRRMGRDIRSAVPNSVRVSGNAFLEFLPTSGGGRYRAEGTATTNCAPNTDNLDFTAADTCFEILGPQMTFATGDQIVVFNLGIPGADAYSGNTAAVDVRRAYNGTVGSAVGRVVMTSGNALPFDSPSKRFHVIPGDQQAVTYACANVGSANGNGTGTLTRYWHYGINSTQATPPAAPVLPAPPNGFSSALVVNNVSSCNITYAAGVTARDGLVSMVLQLMRGGEAVSLYFETHVSNVP